MGREPLPEDFRRDSPSNSAPDASSTNPGKDRTPGPRGANMIGRGLEPNRGPTTLHLRHEIRSLLSMRTPPQIGREFGPGHGPGLPRTNPTTIWGGCRGRRGERKGPSRVGAASPNEPNDNLGRLRGICGPPRASRVGGYFFRNEANERVGLGPGDFPERTQWQFETNKQGEADEREGWIVLSDLGRIFGAISGSGGRLTLWGEVAGFAGARSLSGPEGESSVDFRDGIDGRHPATDNTIGPLPARLAPPGPVRSWCGPSPLPASVRFGSRAPAQDRRKSSRSGLT